MCAKVLWQRVRFLCSKVGVIITITIVIIIISMRMGTDIKL